MPETGFFNAYPAPRQRYTGRENELSLLRGALAEAAAGRGQIVMLAGGPGIGKTRTAQELARHAGETGAQVLWGWCYEGEGAPPYWPWVEPVREYVQRTDAEALRSQTGDSATAIAEFDTSPQTLPGGPTRREAEVLRLIAAGRTDREIGEELVISVRTVTTHVGNILNKTGSANRTEAASYATRNGLD